MRGNWLHNCVFRSKVGGNSGRKWATIPEQTGRLNEGLFAYRLDMRRQELTLDNQHRHSFLKRKRGADAKSEVVHENDKGSFETVLLVWSQSQKN
jgi:hypothetical protein